MQNQAYVEDEFTNSPRQSHANHETNGATNGTTNGATNGTTNGATNGNANGNANSDANGNEHGNGGSNGNTGDSNDENDGVEPVPPGLIELVVKDVEGNLTHFRIKRTMPFRKLFAAYAAKEGKDVKSLRFLQDGLKITETDTAEGKELDNGDIIEVVLEQLGGATGLHA